jgi:hypothetical protein
MFHQNINTYLTWPQLFHENIVAIGVFKFNLIFINRLYIYIKFIRYNPKTRAKLTEFTLGKENCKSFSIFFSLSKNEEISFF